MNKKYIVEQGAFTLFGEGQYTSAEEFDDLSSAEEYYNSVKEDKSKWVLLPLQKLTTTLLEVDVNSQEVIKIINTCII